MNRASFSTPITSAVQERSAELLDDAQRVTHQTDWQETWTLLEDAHELSRPWIRPHIKVHAFMLAAFLDAGPSAAHPDHGEATP